MSKTQVDYKSYDMNNDADITSIAEELVTQVIEEVNDIEYGEHTARKVMPFASKGSKGTETLKYYITDRVGIMHLKEHITDDIERTDVARKPVIQPLFIAENGFQYDIEELYRSQQAARPLDIDKAEMVRTAYEEMVNRVAYTGQDLNGVTLTGLSNHPNVPITTATATFAAMNSEARIQFFLGLATSLYTSSFQRIKPDMILIPTAEYSEMGRKTYINAGVVTDRTELMMLKERFADLFGMNGKVESAPELEGTGASSAQRAICYVNSPRVFYFEESVPLEFGNLQRSNNMFSTATYAKVGGVFVKRPYGLRYGDYSKS